jgi:MFS transporter, DHA1 family, multidrug resistance protein
MRWRDSEKASTWIWLLTLFSVAGFIETFFYGQLFAFTPLYLPHLGIAPADVPVWTGAIVALSSVLGLPFLPFWGALADRYARQPLIVRTFVVHLLAGILALLAGNIWVFVLGRALMSLTLGSTGLMMTTLSERAPRGRLGLAFAIMNTTPPLGAFVGPLVGGPVVDAWGFRVLLAGDSVLMLAVILALTFGYRDTFVATARRPLFQMALESVQLIGDSPRLRTLFPALFLLFGGWMLAYTYVPLAIRALYTGADPGRAIGIILGLGGLTTVVFGPALGALADRFGYWSVLFAGALVETALWPLPALTHGLVGFAVAWAVINGVASGVFAVSFSALSASADSSVRGRIMTFAYLPTYIGFIVGPAIGSVITQRNIFAVFPVAACFTALGIGTLALAAQKKVTTAATPSLT